MAEKADRKRRIRTWGSAAALIGIGMLPCPDCGVPLIIKFWPLATLIAFTKIVHAKIAGIKGETTGSAEPIDDRVPIFPTEDR